MRTTTLVLSRGTNNLRWKELSLLPSKTSYNTLSHDNSRIHRRCPLIELAYPIRNNHDETHPHSTILPRSIWTATRSHLDRNVTQDNGFFRCHYFSTGNTIEQPLPNEEEMDRLQKEARTTDEFEKVLYGYCDIGNLVKAEQILFKMEHLARTTSTSTVCPQSHHYSKIINSYVKQIHMTHTNDNANQIKQTRLHGAPQRAQALLEHMEHIYDEYHSSTTISTTSATSSPSSEKNKWMLEIQPNLNDYHHVMSAWISSKEQEPMFASRAQFIFDKMVNPTNQKSTDKTIKTTTTKVNLNAESFAIMIDAWCKSKEGGAIFMAISMLKRMEYFVQQNNINIIMSDLDSEETTTKNDNQTIHTNMNNTENSLDLEKDRHALFNPTCYPTLTTYKTVFKSLAQSSKTSKAAETAHDILHRMDRAIQAKVTNVKPDMECYELVLLAWSKSRSYNAADIAEDLLLQRMMNEQAMRPSQTCFAHAIHTLCSPIANTPNKSKIVGKTNTNTNKQKQNHNSMTLTNGVDRADAMLIRMEEIYQTMDVFIQPAWTQYYDIITAWANHKSITNASERAMKLIDRMENLPHLSGNNDTIGPLITTNAQIYTAAMKACLSSNTLNKAQQASQLHRHMIDDYLSGNENCKPTVQSYNILLEVCATTGRTIQTNKNRFVNVEEIKQKTIGIAIQAFQELREEGILEGEDEKPDTMTYRHLLQCCFLLLQPGKKQEEVVERIFQNGCRDGLVDKVMLDQFRQWAPYSTCKRLIGRKADVKRHTLPRSWSRNLRTPTILYSNSDGYDNMMMHLDGNSRATENGLRAHKMKGLRAKTNQKILRGGRI